MTKRTRKPFFGPKVIEEFKAARRRELIRRGRPIPLSLLPTEPIKKHDRQRTLPFDTPSKEATPCSKTQP